jgi:hypothetical protein
MNAIRSCCVLTVKMPPPLFQRLEALADTWGVSLSAAARACIEVAAAGEGQERPSYPHPNRPASAAKRGGNRPAMAANGH